MKTLRCAIGLVLVVLLWAAPSSSQTVTYWDESWQGTAADITARWGTTGSYGGFCCTGGDDRPFFHHPETTIFGTSSMRFHYIDEIDGTPTAGGFASRSYAPQNGAIKSAWFTWKHYFVPGFLVSGCAPIGGSGTKGAYLFMWSPSTGQENGWSFTYQWCNRQLSLAAQGIKDANRTDPPETPHQTEVMYQNRNGGFWQFDGRVVCYEAEITFNTPGQSNGLYRLYASDLTAGTPAKLVAEYLNREFLDATNTRPPGTTDPPGGAGTAWMPADAGWYRWRLFRQSGRGDMHYGRLQVTSARVGCGSVATQPGDTTNPNPPTNLAVQ